MPSFSPINGRRKLFSRQIPTIMGLLILMVALGAGVLFFNDGFAGFAPRATPETTPKNVKITNVSDTGFTVSFLTDAATTGYIKYGTSADNLNSQAGDERDQLSGTVSEYTLHHISVRGLTPTTLYYFVLGTGGTSEFDNQGTPFILSTGPTVSATAVSKTIYGNVVNTTGGPAEGSVVYVRTENSGELSALVKNSGSWAVSLNTARTIDGLTLVEITDDTVVQVMAQGITPTLTAQTQATVITAQPVETLTLGGTSQAESQTITPSADPYVMDTATDESPVVSPLVSPQLTLTDSPLPATEDTLLAENLQANELVDLTLTVHQTVTTGQPVIVGQAAPNVLVTLEVHSETAITQQLSADTAGQFTLNIANLQETLEPGEHTATYSYVDPLTGQTITKAQTFTVASDTSTLLAQANQTGGPYSSGNPFPVPSPTPTLLPSPTPISTQSATPSGQTSQPSTGSGMPVSGSTGTTMALIGGGIFFVLAGAWSFWVAQNLQPAQNEDN